jgi:hypothetical protein
MNNIKKNGKKRQPRMVGSGAYNMRPMLDSLREAIKPAVKQALISAGGVLGGQVGSSSAGSELGRRISRLIGSGDYETNDTYANSLIKGSAVPNVSFGKTALAIRVKHREFLGDIMTGPVAGAFTNYSYPVNAGLRNSFPYLSQLASNHEEYCFHGLVFEFISTASPYSAASALGSNIAAMEYNAAAPTFTSKFAMENSTAAISGRLDRNLMYGVECAANSNVQNCYYVRSGVSSLPVTTTDLGNFQFAVAPAAGVPTGSVVGELWVTYDCSLDRPILNLDDLGFIHAYRTVVTAATNPLGSTSSFTRSHGSLSGSSVSATAVSLSSCNIGDVVILSVTWTGTVAAVIAFPAVTTVGLSQYNGFVNGTSYVQGTGAGVSNTTANAQYMYLVTAKNPVITFGLGGTLPTGTTTLELTMNACGNNTVLNTDW